MQWSGVNANRMPCVREFVSQYIFVRYVKRMLMARCQNERSIRPYPILDAKLAAKMEEELTGEYCRMAATGYRLADDRRR